MTFNEGSDRDKVSVVRTELERYMAGCKVTSGTGYAYSNSRANFESGCRTPVAQTRLYS
jgi:hypothetical protein